MLLARRNLLKTGLALGAVASGLAAAPLALAFPEASVRRLAFDNLHTGEHLDVTYWENGAYASDGLAAVNHVLRDHRTGEVHDIAPRLLDLLTALAGRLEARPSFAVISGYRSPATNAMLHERSGQVASGSLHMVGEAIDIRMADLDLAHVHDAAMTLGLGGVGYYPTSDFVHVDVGRRRHWSGA